MKIVHISHLYYPSRGGVQTYFKNISERLVRDYKDDVTVVTTDSYYGPEKAAYRKIEPASEVINGVKVIRFSYRRWHLKPYRFLYKLLRAVGKNLPEEMTMQLRGPYSPAMKQYLTTVEADVFFASSSNYYFMQLPLWRRCNFFYFASIHLEEDKRKDYLLQKQLTSMNASTLYIANTHFEKQRMAGMGVKEDKIFVLGCGVDMDPFLQIEPQQVQAFRQKMALPADALVIGYIGRIESTKNVKIAIEAFENVSGQHPDAYLLIAGSGNSYADELQAYCSHLPQTIGNKIKWLTEFASEDKTALFHSIDMLVLPSKNESFGIVFLEAWCCRKPVIGAAIGAVSDVVSDGTDGLLTAVDSSIDVAQKISILLSDKSLRTKLGDNGFKKVQENYTWDIIVARLRNCYVEALENSKKVII